MKPIYSTGLDALYEAAYVASDDAKEFRRRIDNLMDNPKINIEDKKKKIIDFIKEKSENPCTSIMVECVLGSCEI